MSLVASWQLDKHLFKWNNFMQDNLLSNNMKHPLVAVNFIGAFHVAAH